MPKLDNPGKALMACMKQEFGALNFVETGTHLGKTTLWASARFDRVYTIEGSREFYERTSQKLAQVKNIEFFLGSSREQLGAIVAKLDAPAVFWLDAHWMGDSATYDQDECPVLGEIEIINSSQLDHFIFIDDARLFLSPPPKPLSIEGWPAIAAVFQALERRDRYVVVFDDAIVAVPRRAEEFTAGYCQRMNTLALQRNQDEKNRRLYRTVKRSKRILYLIWARLKALLP